MKEDNKNSIKGYISALLSAVVFGLTPLIASFVEKNGISNIEMTFLRGVMAAFAVGIFNLIRGEKFRITGKEALKIAFLSLTGSVLTTIFLMKAYLWINTGVATTLNFSYPIVVLLLGILVYKEKCGGKTYACFCLCMIGIILLCEPGGNFTWKGFFLALMSGITYGLYVLYLDKSNILQTVSLWNFTFWFFAFTAIITIPFMAISGHWESLLSPKGLLWSGIYSIGDGLLASVLIQIAVQNIGSRKTSLIASAEPVTSALIGCFVLHEILTVRSVLGILLIIAATTCLILFNRSGHSTDDVDRY